MEEQEEPKKKRGGFANPEVARRAGKKGGRSLLDSHGTDHFKRLGESGGAAVAAKYGRGHFREIGKLGGDTRWDREKARKEEEGA